ncbi:MAG: AIR synthase-related protein, partial [Halobacteriaceae archaeon]
GLGGASFASEDLDEDSETEDRPAVQVGDPYTEKLLIEANEDIVGGDLAAAARDLGAAGLGGATCEMAAQGDLGARIELGAVHQREPGMNATEILLSESQERMCYEVAPENVEAVRDIADRYDLGSAVVGEVTEGRYVCTFEGETVVDLPAEFAADGAPTNDLDAVEPPAVERDLPDAPLAASVEAVLADPNTASKEWVYRQYDHEVGVRTALRPGGDAAVLALREAGGESVGLAVSAGANPRWTDAAPREGAHATAVENATNLAATGAEPLAAVDCLNGGNPEKPAVYGGFRAIVEGLAAGCRALSVPVVGGNVSLYNDSAAGPIPPTPTVAMLGTRAGTDARTLDLAGAGDLLLVGGHATGLGGSAYLAHAGGADRFPGVEEPDRAVAAVRAAATHPATEAVHDVSDGGLAVALAEMVGDAGARVEVPDAPALFSEAPGRAVVETTDAGALRESVDAPVAELGTATDDGTLALSVGGESLTYDAAAIAEMRGVIGRELD